MSNRALRRLQGSGGDLLIPDEGNLDSDDEPEVPVVPSSKKKKKKKAAEVANVFDLLNEDDDGDKNEDNEPQPDSDENDDTPMPDEPIKSNTKKKKKKKKKKGKDTVETTTAPVEEEDEIEASIREVNRILNEGNASGPGINMVAKDSASSSCDKGLLSVEHKYLNHENELKKIFGSRVIQAEHGRRRNPQRRRQKVSWMAQPKDSWPPMGKIGLSMSLKETKNGCQYFVFEHNHQYQQIQFQFYDAVESLNPQNIGNILQLQPYHIDALIQLSEVFRMSEDHNMAAELIERALYTMEINFHPLFNMATGNSRLEYKYRENRSLHLALFKQILSMGQRGCNRTALEYCKFLLSLDPDADPLCALLMLDFYALRSGQHDFLLRLFNEWEAHRNLSQLPNYALSVPLAMFLSTEDDTSKADEMLQDSLLMFPAVVRPLLEKCSVQGDSSVSHQYFMTAETSQSEGLKHLIALYVGRCFPCWKVPEVMEWLEKNVKQVVDLVENKDPRLETYKQRRLTRYMKTPRNIYRHILVSEIPSATATIPQDVASLVLNYDPLPPLDSVEAYTRPSRPNRAQTEQGGLSAFLRSLLPNYNPNDPAPEGGAAAAAGGEGHQLRQGVGALMEAMRDLLNNIRMVEHPIENGAADGEREPEREPEEWD